MRGMPERQMAMLTTLNAGDLIPEDHPIRRIRVVVDAVLFELDDEFAAMYATTGRPSVPPEQLLKATVLMAMYSIRSERAFCERLNYDLLFIELTEANGYAERDTAQFVVDVRELGITPHLSGARQRSGNVP